MNPACFDHQESIDAMIYINSSLCVLLLFYCSSRLIFGTLDSILNISHNFSLFYKRNVSTHDVGLFLWLFSGRAPENNHLRSKPCWFRSKGG